MSNLLPALREYIEQRRGTLSDEDGPMLSAQDNVAATADRNSLSPGLTVSGMSTDDAVYSSAHRDSKAAHILPTISLLAVNLMHASEEKVNLAQATYDSVSS